MSVAPNPQRRIASFKLASAEFLPIKDTAVQSNNVVMMARPPTSGVAL